MKLTKRGEYGLRTLIKLGIAREMGRELVSVSDLAAMERLPLKFVENILADLRHAGMVGTRRGKFGGYFLARDPVEITVGEAVRVLDGMLAPIACASVTAYQPCNCEDEEHCGLRMLMLDVRNAISAILDRYNLSDIVAVTLRKMKRDGLPIPFSEEYERARDAAAASSGGEGPSTSEGFLAWLQRTDEADSDVGDR